MFFFITYPVTAVKLVLSIKKYFVFFILFALFFFAFLIYIPVTSIPGNDLKFQLSILTIKDYFVLAGLSILASLSFTLNLFSSVRDFNLRNSGSYLIRGGGSLSGLVASVFGTASCASCIGSVFGFLGTGGVFFLIKYKNPITWIASFIVLVSIYFSSKRVLGICNVKDFKKTSKSR